MRRIDDLQPGHVMQLDPEHVLNPAFGAQGYVQALGNRHEMGGRAYYRATWEEMEGPIGRAIWMPGTEEDAPDGQ